jgi:uncharacterized membrane protein
MSTAITDKIPSVAPSEAPSTSTFKIPFPYLWLLGILVLGGLLRWYQSTPFQSEEYPTAAAVLERQGVPLGSTAAESDPLVPVASLDEVSQRSVIPYGIRDPLPLYHDLLWFTVKVLPPSDWALRLPSLLAGIGCIAVVFFLVKRFLGIETALAAALFAALDPIQLTLSWQARPYALGNLFAALSFLAVVGLFSAKNKLCVGLWSLGYGIFVALVGYFSPAMLVLTGAHLAFIVFVAATRKQTDIAVRIGLWVVGLVLASILLSPEIGYYAELWRFGQEHGQYLQHLANFRVLTTGFFHNLTLIAGFLLIVAAGAVVRWQMEGGDEETAPEGRNADSSAKAEPASPKSDPATREPVESVTKKVPRPQHREPNWFASIDTIASKITSIIRAPQLRELFWLAMFWVLIPQLLALIGVAVSEQPSFATRYLGFTTLGVAILLAAYASQERTREARLGMMGALALGLLILGFFPDFSAGVGLFGNERGPEMMQNIRTQLNEPPWQDGDVLLMRSALPEVDFLKTAIPEENRAAVQRAGFAPVATLFPDSRRRPVILLTYSQYRTDKLHPGVGKDCKADLEKYYDDEFAKTVFSHKRYWLAGLTPRQSGRKSEYNSNLYLACTLLWIADRGDWDLSIARNRGKSGEPEHYVLVPANVPTTLNVDGLTDNVEANDYGLFVHLARPKEPSGIFTLGVLSTALNPNAHIVVPVEFTTQFPTPSLAVAPKSKENPDGAK